MSDDAKRYMICGGGAHEAPGGTWVRADDYASLRAEVKRLNGTLKLIADHGCGLTTVRDGEWVRCCDLYPTNREEWCWSCIAAAAIEEHGDE